MSGDGITALALERDGAAHAQASAPTAPPQRPGPVVTTAFGFGAVAAGVIETGFNYFLLIFYSQVIGLDARLVGLAIAISLVFDVVADPIVGYWSDNLRSRWGRRHPFLYVSAVPVALFYALIWMPPEGASQSQLFWYLLSLSIAARLALSLYETPSSALNPELTSDYDARSTLQSVRYFFGWSGGNVMTVLMFGIIFPLFVTSTITNGQFNREAYVSYGAIAGGLAMASILVCALGTHARIPHMAPPPPSRRYTLGSIFREMYDTLADRSFVALFTAAVLGAIATGVSASLTFYLTTYFWGFSSGEVAVLTVAVFASAALGAGIAPIASRRLGKKRGAMIIGLIAFLGAPLPIVLRLLGLLPGNEDPSIFWIVLVTNTVDTGLIIAFQILTSAMIADLVEQAELKTGRRSEGVFFAAIFSIRKAVPALGILAASFMLTAVAFPKGADADAVPADVLWNLGAAYVPTVLALWLSMMAVLNTYRLGRGDHEENLRKLDERRAGTAAPLAPAE